MHFLAMRIRHVSFVTATQTWRYKSPDGINVWADCVPLTLCERGGEREEGGGKEGRQRESIAALITVSG